jgi:hypothetical protein
MKVIPETCHAHLIKYIETYPIRTLKKQYPV